MGLWCPIKRYTAFPPHGHPHGQHPNNGEIEDITKVTTLIARGFKLHNFWLSRPTLSTFTTQTVRICSYLHYWLIQPFPSHRTNKPPELFLACPFCLNWDPSASPSHFPLSHFFFSEIQSLSLRLWTGAVDNLKHQPQQQLTAHIIPSHRDPLFIIGNCRLTILHIYIYIFIDISAESESQHSRLSQREKKNQTALNRENGYCSFLKYLPFYESSNTIIK